MSFPKARSLRCVTIVSKGQRSRSPGRFTQRGLITRNKAAASVRVGTFRRGKLLLRLGGVSEALAAHGGGEARRHIVSPRAQLVRFNIRF